MKRIRALALSVALLATGLGSALAQTATVVINPDQATVIQKYFVVHKPKVVAIPSGFTVEVGAVVPDSIVLEPLDVPDLQLSTPVEYVVLDGKTVIVDPTTRKVLQIL
jgi:hypothetical protein